MYSSFHSSVAIGILLMDLTWSVKVPLAVASHIAVDALGEHGVKNSLKWEIPLHAFLCAVGLFISPFMLGVILSGVLCGNAIDIFDKIFMQRLIGKELIHSAPWYPKLIIQFTEKQTIWADVISVIIAGGLLWAI